MCNKIRKNIQKKINERTVTYVMLRIFSEKDPQYAHGSGKRRGFRREREKKRNYINSILKLCVVYFQ